MMKFISVLSNLGYTQNQIDCVISKIESMPICVVNVACHVVKEYIAMGLSYASVIKYLDDVINGSAVLIDPIYIPRGLMVDF